MAAKGGGTGRGGQWRDVMSKYADRSTSKYFDFGRCAREVNGKEMNKRRGKRGA